LRPEGGSSGQNGMKSIIERLGTQKFPRLRLGIGRPPGRMDPAAYVLQDFKEADGEIMDMTLDKAVEAIETFVKEGLNAAMNKFNGNPDDPSITNNQ
ncbi:MAG TPA: aminoacyl-tRNA hydrolase, partial [Anaerolineales bacterium]|nr:aminoacyl-tRNA hydrolase [Anaerolineales bacterium]